MCEESYVAQSDAASLIRISIGLLALAPKQMGFGASGEWLIIACHSSDRHLEGLSWAVAI